MAGQHARQIPWLRISLEGMVIVVSVLLALAADAWWDGRQRRAEELFVLRGLQDDLQETLRVIHTSRQGSEGAALSAERLIDLGLPGSAVSAATFDSLLARTLVGTPFTPVDATLNSLLASDGLSIISSPALRRQLAQWTPAVSVVRRVLGQLDQQTLNQIMPYLYERVPIRTLDALSRPETGAQPSAFTRDSRTLLKELQFENYMNDVLFYNRLLVARLDALEAHVDQSLSLVRAELGDR